MYPASPGDLFGIHDSFPRLALFGWKVVVRHFNLRDEGSGGRMQDVTNLSVALFEFFSPFDLFHNLWIVASSNQHGQKVFAFGNSLFSDFTDSLTCPFQSSFSLVDCFDWKFLIARNLSTLYFRTFRWVLKMETSKQACASLEEKGDGLGLWSCFS